MRNFLRSVFPFILLLLVLVVAFALGFVLVGGVAIGLGYLLMRFSVFSLFEATVLAMVFAAITGYLITALLRSLGPEDVSRWPSNSLDEAAEWEEDYKPISASRFYSTEIDRTWKAWLGLEIANDIYAELQDDANAVSNLSDVQVQELSIRLSELAIANIQRKRGGRRLSITVPALKREMTKTEQRPYDDDIMRLAVGAVNMNLDYYRSVLMDVIRGQKNGMNRLKFRKIEVSLILQVQIEAAYARERSVPR